MIVEHLVALVRLATSWRLLERYLGMRQITLGLQEAGIFVTGYQKIALISRPHRIHVGASCRRPSAAPTWAVAGGVFE